MSELGDLCGDFPVLLEGGTGTGAGLYGTRGEECPEIRLLQEPQRLTQWQRQFVEAGAQMLIAPTRGINEIHLARWDAVERMEELARSLVELTRQSAQGRPVGGAMTSLGVDIYPQGEDYTLEDVYAIYRHSAQALLAAGVDFFVVESVLTMAEARMALLAIKELCDKPVILSLTVDDEGDTREDVNILAALVTLQSMGAAGFGLNGCPASEMLEHLELLAPHATIPLYAKPTAFAPADEGGAALTPQQFAEYGVQFARMGVRYIGGCRGAGPEHIRALAEAMKGQEFHELTYEGDPDTFIATNEKDYFFLDHVADISHPLECSEDMSDQILAAEDEGYAILQVEVSHIDDVDFLMQNYYMLGLPLCIKTDNIALLEAVARMYNGRLILANSDEFDPQMLQYIIQKYGLIVL
ncbi:MAG: homocysteine S-methyltransferase family protein [Eubacteriales bacterium]|jgi:5-methyltetrahydrofolate--homocysteine methyltransferase